MSAGSSPAGATKIKMRYVYTNYGTNEEVPQGTVFVCDAEDIIAADKLFFASMGFKMSDRKASQIGTWSPDWAKGAVSEDKTHG